MKGAAIKFNDIETGTIIETGRFKMSPERIREFAGQYDPQEMHMDEAAAVDGPFGELVASGWHTLCVTMKLVVESKPLGDTPLVGAGVDNISFKRPVYPNDELFVRATITEKRKSIKSGRGFVVFNIETINAGDGEIVLSQKWTLTLTE